MLVAIGVMFKLALTSRPIPKQNKTKMPSWSALCLESDFSPHAQKASHGPDITK